MPYSFALESMPVLKDANGKLILIVYNDLKKKAQVFHKTEEFGVQDAKEFLEQVEVATRPPEAK